MEQFLNAQHCLTIAAAFIAIVAACATLINIANAKADSLATRYRETTKEYRAEGENTSRRAQLQKQIDLFEKRTRKVSWAQCFLFATIGIFILSLTIFISLGLYIIYFNVAQQDIYVIARMPIKVIGAFVIIGAVSMIAAIGLQYCELVYAKWTFDIETEDCRAPKHRDASIRMAVEQL